MSDTTKVEIRKDTIITIGDKIEKVVTIETISYREKNPKDVFFTSELLGKLFWPLTVIIIVLLFRKEIKNIFNRAKKLGLPGGFSVETMEESIEKATELAKDIKLERNAEKQRLIDKVDPKFESKANQRMIELGLNPSPSGLAINYYRKLTNEDPRLALAGLRIDLEIMLKNLAKGFQIAIDDKTPVLKIVSNLLDKGAITSKQYEFINTVFRISSSAIHGQEITKEQVLKVINIAQVLIDDYIAWLSWGFKK